MSRSEQDAHPQTVKQKACCRTSIGCADVTTPARTSGVSNLPAAYKHLTIGLRPNKGTEQHATTPSLLPAKPYRFSVVRSPSLLVRAVVYVSVRDRWSFLLPKPQFSCTPPLPNVVPKRRLRFSPATSLLTVERRQTGPPRSRPCFLAKRREPKPPDLPCFFRPKGSGCPAEISAGRAYSFSQLCAPTALRFVPFPTHNGRDESFFRLTTSCLCARFLLTFAPVLASQSQASVKLLHYETLLRPSGARTGIPGFHSRHDPFRAAGLERSLFFCQEHSWPRVQPPVW